jgi:nucleotide-binding universal stress UspA family protein
VVDVRLLQGPVFTDLSGAIGIPPYQEIVPAIESSLEAKAEAILREFLAQCEAAGVPAETKKATGVIDETIIEEGKNCCDWIILAQRGEHFHLGDGAILGSTAQSVVRSSGKPVLVTPGHYQEIESMAVAYDGSAPAKKALLLAAELSAAASWPLSVVTDTDDQALAAAITQDSEEALSPNGSTVPPSSSAARRIGTAPLSARGGGRLLVMGAFATTVTRS